MKRIIALTGLLLMILFTSTLVHAVSISSFSTLDYPGAIKTYAEGISGDTIVGSYYDGKTYHGFSYDGKTWNSFNYQGTSASTSATSISGNTIAGYYMNDNGFEQGFLYDGKNWTTLSYPGSISTFITDISGNTVVGNYYDVKGAHAFQYDGKTWSTLSFPNVFDERVVPYGVSGNTIVGHYTDKSGNGKGFMYDGMTLTTLNYPGALWTYPFAINESYIVGEYGDGSQSHGFLYDGATWVSFDYPDNMPFAYATGIDGNTIIGLYFDSAGTHGLTATFSGETPPPIPEPATGLLLGFGSLIAAGIRKRLKKR